MSRRFAPPWGKPSYDTRLPLLKEDAHIVHELTHRSTGRLLLFNQEHLFATTTCVGCEFQVYQLEVTAQPTEGGGIRHLRVWSRQRFHPQGVKWAQGRNQAVFSGPVGRRSGPQESALYVLSASPPDATTTGISSRAFAAIRYVQPWLGLVASMGVPRFRSRLLDSCYKAQAAWWGKVTLGEHEEGCGRRTHASRRG